MKRIRYRTLAGYLLAGIVLLIGMLYLRFPGKALMDYITAAAPAHHPGLRVTIEALQPSFPPGLTLRNVAVGLNTRPDALFQATRLSLRPGGLALLTGRLTLLAGAQAYGGELQGELAFARRFSLSGPLSLEATFTGLRVERSAWLREWLSRQVTGILRGRVTLNGPAGALRSGSGTLDFTLANGTFPLRESFLGLDKLDFSRIEGRASFSGGALRVTQVTLTADNFRCSLKGNILPADDPRESRIDLNGTIELPGQGNKRLTVTIDGTLGNPQVRAT